MKIITDTGSDILEIEAKAMGVDLVPISANFADVIFDRNTEENFKAFYEKLRSEVKLKIARALTKLMDTKAFSDISVTDIITTARVARASYYRNFHSKEEVLIKITDDIMEEYRKRAEKLENDFFSYEAILLIFRYFKTYKKFILSVYKAGLAYIYLDLFDQELENHMGDMPYNDIHRYKVYFYSGALYNVFLKWLQNGMKEHPSAMASMVTEMLEQGAYPLA